MKRWVSCILQIGLLLAMGLSLANIAVVSAAEKPGITSRSVTGTATATGLVKFRKEVKCEAPEIKIGNECTRPECPSNKQWQGNKCVCPSGTDWNSKAFACKTTVTEFKCPAGSTPEPGKPGSCIWPCPEGKYRKQGKGECVCPAGLVDKGAGCQQPPRPDVAFTCPPGSTPSTRVKNTCVLPCPTGMQLNAQDQCACKAPTVQVGNTCITAAQITISPQQLSKGECNDKYYEQLVGNGGTGSYKWILTGSLPDGLELSDDGKISGTPTKEGASSFTIGAQDKALSNFNAIRNYSIVIKSGEIGCGDKPTPTACAVPPSCGPNQVQMGCVCQPTVTQPPVITSTTTLYPTEVQTELKDLRCLTGNVDGVWGGQSKTALRKFSYLPNSKLAGGTDQPTLAAKTAVQSRSAPRCPETVYRPNCNVPYAYPSGNTCKCEGGRQYTGSACVYAVKKPPSCKWRSCGKGGSFDKNKCACKCHGNYYLGNDGKCKKPYQTVKPKPTKPPVNVHNDLVSVGVLIHAFTNSKKKNKPKPTPQPEYTPKCYESCVDGYCERVCE